MTFFVTGANNVGIIWYNSTRRYNPIQSSPIAHFFVSQIFILYYFIDTADSNISSPYPKRHHRNYPPLPATPLPIHALVTSQYILGEPPSALPGHDLQLQQDPFQIHLGGFGHELQPNERERERERLYGRGTYRRAKRKKNPTKRPTVDAASIKKTRALSNEAEHYAISFPSCLLGP